MPTAEGFEINVPIVSAIIERTINGVRHVLVQTRWKPGRDVEYSGTLEIPAGWIDLYEDVHEAVKREVLEETGLKVSKMHPDTRTQTFSPKDDGSFAFVPFCCQQQIKGGRPWIGFVFLCEVEEGDPVAQESEVRDIRWMQVDELRALLRDHLEQVFTLQLGPLDYYLNHYLPNLN